MRRILIISLLAGLGLATLAPARADEVQIQADAPDRYIVVKGDTLWDISGRFLKQPWRWPEIWRLNKDEIKDPHWIYPGDVVVLDRTQHPPRLSLARPGEGGAGGDQALSAEDQADGRKRLSPHVETLPHESAIPSIPLRDVQAFMGHPLVVEPGEVDSLPQVVAFDGHRTLGSVGDTVFAKGTLPAGVAAFQVFRPGTALHDPITGEVLAYRADYVGNVRLSEAGEIARFTITKDEREVGIGDRLMVPEASSQLNFVPSAPAKEVAGAVIATPDGHTMAGRHEVVVVSLGSRDGLMPGNILAVYPTEQEVNTHTAETLTLPQTRSGLLFVFRCYDRVSYALVVQSQRTLHVLDTVRNP